MDPSGSNKKSMKPVAKAHLHRGALLSLQPSWLLPGLSSEQGRLPNTYLFNCTYVMKSSTKPVDLPSGGASVPPEISMLPVVSSGYSSVLLGCTEHVGILPGSS